MFYFGLIVLGILGIITIGCFTEMILPNSSSNIPLIGTFIETINSTLSNSYNTLINFFTNNLPDNGGGNIPSPEPISRESSNGSDTSQITIKDLRWRTPNSSPKASSSKTKLEDITPPISRTATPYPYL